MVHDGVPIKRARYVEAIVAIDNGDYPFAGTKWSGRREAARHPGIILGTSACPAKQRTPEKAIFDMQVWLPQANLIRSTQTSYKSRFNGVIPAPRTSPAHSFVVEQEEEDQTT